VKYYLQVLKKYAKFHGRASRTEFWMFFLFNFIFEIALLFIEIIAGIKPISQNSGYGILVLLYQLAIFVPFLAVSIRRMHDTDHAGHWLVIPIANIVLLLKAGTPGENGYGADPRIDTEPIADEEYRKLADSHSRKYSERVEEQTRGGNSNQMTESDDSMKLTHVTCPKCYKLQSIRNTKCSRCGQVLSASSK
jgi:uncharacterized membrane protein YhaH (DUF805 family)